MPVLLQIGNFQLKTMTVFALLALVTAMFVFWRKVKEEHFDEFEITDIFLFSGIIAWVLARISYILLHIQQFSSVIDYLDIFSKPGSSLFVLAVFWATVIILRLRKSNYDTLQVLDYWALGLSAGFLWLLIGWFVSASHLGAVTQLPWGVQFPQVFDKRHPTQLYSLFLFFLLYLLLSKLEYRYRGFVWYKGRSSAKSGFLLSVFMIWGSISWLIISILKSPELVLANSALELPLGLAVLFAGVGLLFWRSGKNPFHKWLRSKHEQKVEKFTA